MASPDTPQSTAATAPFDQPSADLILRTADLVDFRVHSQILAQASPFFASMLTLPQAPACPPSTPGAPGLDAGPPVVPVSEDRATLELLLRLVYPIPKPRAQMDDPQMMVPALRAAMKYDMALPVEIMSERLAAITPTSPLQAWAVACRTGLEDIACGAAEALKKTWTRPDKLEALAFMDELGDMSGISAGDYFRLKQYLMSEPGATTECSNLLSPPPNPEQVGNSQSEGASSPGFSTDIPGTDVECWPSSNIGQTTPFAAHQSVLAIHSPVWKSQIASLRAASASARSNQPLTLQFDEDPATLSALLQICYTHEKGKYDMPHIVAYIRLAWDDAASRNPLEAYFIAVNHRLRDCAKAAAKEVLVKKTALTYVSVMERLPPLVYHCLLVYYDTCRTMLREQALQALANLPERVYNHSRRYVDITDIRKAWEGAIDREWFGSLEGIKQVFQEELDMFLEKLASHNFNYMSYNDSGVTEYLRGFLHCAFAKQDGTERALNDDHSCHWNIGDISTRSTGMDVSGRSGSGRLAPGAIGNLNLNCTL
ncbi:hypothetical protein C2E23DRAFT_856301 [Lenzites betulinus]|nr:hypothetical protein C2E23DRAFT_856301 [Lenzites betulinus]